MAACLAKQVDHARLRQLLVGIQQVEGAAGRSGVLRMCEWGINSWAQASTTVEGHSKYQRPSAPCCMCFGNPTGLLHPSTHSQLALAVQRQAAIVLPLGGCLRRRL